MAASRAGTKALQRKKKKGTTKRPTRITPEKKRMFLNHLAQGYSFNGSALVIGSNRVTMRTHCRNDPEFAQQCEDAVEAGTDLLEDEARRRAKEGVQEPVYYKGEIVGVINKYSDVLLMFTLKGRRPYIWRENSDEAPKDQTDKIIEVIRAIKED